MNPVTAITDEQFTAARNELELARRAAASDDSYVPRLVRAFRTMAELYLRNGQTSRAEGLLREAGFRIAEAKMPLPAETAAVTTSLAMLYDSLDRPEKAAEQYSRALTALETAGALNTRAGLSVCRACARLSLSRGEKVLAQMHLQKALQIAEVLGGDGTDAVGLREELKALGAAVPAAPARQSLPLPPPEMPAPAASPAVPRRFAAEAPASAPAPEAKPIARPAPAPAAPAPVCHINFAAPAPAAPVQPPVMIRVNAPLQPPPATAKPAAPVPAPAPVSEALPAPAPAAKSAPVPPAAPAPRAITAPVAPPPARDLSVRRVTAPVPAPEPALPPRHTAPVALPAVADESRAETVQPSAFRPLPIEIEPLTPILPVLSLFSEDQAGPSRFRDAPPPVRAPRGRVGSLQGL